MGKDANLAREERLAAKLRENLRRRKEQARAAKSAKDTDPPSRLREGPGVGANESDNA